MAEVCIICNGSGTHLATCRDIKSWETLYCAAVIRDHKGILELSVGESDFPRRPEKYHRACRSEFTHRRDLQVKNTETATNDPVPRRSSRDVTQSSVVLQDCCIFCNKIKYKPNSKTREKLHGMQEFRADETVRKCASLHIQQCTATSAVAQRVIGLCAKDLICSEAKYHASCYKAFVRIQYTTGNPTEDEALNDYDHDFFFNFFYFFKIIIPRRNEGKKTSYTATK